MNTLDKGRAGEDQARAYLETKGYRLMQANYRTPLGEVDLIMKHKDSIVFVEVKTRGGGTSFGFPQEAVTPSKQRKIVKAAVMFLKINKLTDSPLRFDVVSISPRGIDHIENAFGVPANRYTL